MSLLLQGLEMPNEHPRTINIYRDGTWVDAYTTEDGLVIDVQTHGKLIDRGALWVEINKICDRRDAGIITDLNCLQQILSAVRHAPTVIHASKEKT